jgi:hypothetical protein
VPIENAIKEVKKTKDVFSPRDILEELQRIESCAEDRNERNAARSAQKYVKRIIGMKVFTNVSTSIDKMLQPMRLSGC